MKGLGFGSVYVACHASLWLVQYYLFTQVSRWGGGSRCPESVMEHQSSQAQANWFFTREVFRGAQSQAYEFLAWDKLRLMLSPGSCLGSAAGSGSGSVSRAGSGSGSITKTMVTVCFFPTGTSTQATAAAFCELISMDSAGSKVKQGREGRKGQFLMTIDLDIEGREG